MRALMFITLFSLLVLTELSSATITPEKFVSDWQVRVAGRLSRALRAERELLALPENIAQRDYLQTRVGQIMTGRVPISLEEGLTFAYFLNMSVADLLQFAMIREVFAQDPQFPRSTPTSWTKPFFRIAYYAVATPCPQLLSSRSTMELVTELERRRWIVNLKPQE